MLSYIKDHFRQRKENQNRSVFHNHSNRKAQPIMTAVKQTAIDMPFRKENVRQRKQEQLEKKLKDKSADNKTIETMPDQGRPEKLTANTADELANFLAKADNRRRGQLPCYPGLERFKMVRKLGDGAFSNVFEALDLKTGKKVAIKVAQKSIPGKNTGQSHLHSSIIKKPKVTERANIIKELQIMRNVRHPNIVQLIHYTENSENYFLTLDLCEGGELFHQIVKLTYFSENLSRHIITQVALAVRHLHEECGVVHRDIKPENILFDPIPIIPSKNRVYRPTDNIDTKEDEGEFLHGIGGGGIGKVKLADFGLSKVIWDNATMTPCGTVGYAAPEIICDKTYSKSVDMWAIGCVLYTILCGFPPFYDESIPLLTEKVARGQYTYLSPWWDTASDAVKDLISHLLCVDVKKRYTIDQFLSHPWVTEEPFISNDISTEKEVQQNISQNLGKPNVSYVHQQEIVMTESHQTTPSNLWTPLEVDQNVFTTPDAATLRGIFDITYAVQRMEEEKSFTDAHQETDTTNNDKNSLCMQVPSSQKNHNLSMAQKLAQNSRGVADPVNYRYYQKTQDQKVLLPATTTFDGVKNRFQLDLNNATLLKNRKVGLHDHNNTTIKNGI